MQKPQPPPQFIIQEIVGGNTTGVTTRGSVAALQREQQQQPSDENETLECATSEHSMQQPLAHYIPMDNNTNTDTAQETTLTPPTSTTPPPPITPPPPSASATVTITTTTTTASTTITTTPAVTTTTTTITITTSTTETDVTVKEETVEPTDDESTNKQGLGQVRHECCVCKSSLQYLSESRPLSKLQASQFSLDESTLAVNARVCSSCRCQLVQKQYSNSKCPMPTCPSKVKGATRMRPLPAKWKILEAELKQAIIKELQIPTDMKKCCKACHNRITRKMGENALSSDGEDNGKWSDAEMTSLRQALSKVGRQWDKVAEIVRTKTSCQCQSFYRNHKKEHRLFLSVKEYKSTSEGKQASEDDESTESSEECAIAEGSDTASASSPARATVVAPSKEDYDSSATVSADEGQDESPPKIEYLRIPQMKQFPANSAGAIKPDQLPVPVTDAQGNRSFKMRDVIEHTIEKSMPVNPPQARPGAAMSPTIESLLGREQQERLRAAEKSGARPGESVKESRFSVPQPVQDNPEDLSVRRTPRSSPSLLGPPSLPQPPPSGRQYCEPPIVRRSPEGLTERKNPPPPAHQSNFRPFDPRQDPFYPPSPYKSQSGSGFSHSRTSTSPVVVRSQVPPPTKPSMKGSLQQAPMQQTPPPPLIPTSKHITVPSPKSKLTGGSITHGTPVQQLHMQTPTTRYGDSLGGGSITQGTPMASNNNVPRASVVYDRIHLDQFYKRSPNFSYSRPPYPPESPQISTRQIILDDFMTSQNMPGKKLIEKEQQPKLSPRTSETGEGSRGFYYPASSGYPSQSSSAPVYLARPTTTSVSSWHQTSTPPPPHQRQVIVQRGSLPRHTQSKVVERYSPSQSLPKSQSPRQGQYLSGHEAFSALVDVAVAQPNLAVSKDSDKRGVVVTEHPRYTDYQRVPVSKSAIEPDVNKLISKQQAMIPKSDGSSWTAANLIDAIITRSINQGVAEQPKNPDPLFSKFSKGAVPTAGVLPAHPDAGKVSPYKVPQPQKEVVTIEDTPESTRRISEPGSDGQVAGKAMTWGEHIGNLIDVKYSVVQVPNAVGHYQTPESSQAESAYVMQPNWKLRKALQQEESRGEGDERQIIRVAQSSRKPRLNTEPVSPPDSASIAPSTSSSWVNGADAMAARVLTTRRPEPAPPTISPIDYVKNKIVEVMRNSESSEGGEASAQYKRNLDTSRSSEAEEKRARTDEPSNSEKEETKTETVDSPQSNEDASKDASKHDSPPKQYPPHRSVVVSSTHFSHFSSMPPHYSTPVYQFPYSALSVRSNPADSKPVLNSQYEPLSDED